MHTLGVFQYGLDSETMKGDAVDGEPMLEWANVKCEEESLY